MPMWWKRALFWSLMPLAAPQGLLARRRAPRFPAAAGPAEGRVGAGPGLRLLAIGDSIIEGVGCRTLEEAFAGQFARHLAQATGCEVHWRALGRTGACAAGIREGLLPAVEPGAFDLAVVSVGVNDVSSLKRSARFRADLAALLDGLVERAAPGGLVVLCGLPRMETFPLLPQPLRFLAGLRAETFDAIGAALARARAGVHHEPTAYVPAPHEFAPDGYHPNAATQGLWAGRLVERLMARGCLATPPRTCEGAVAS